MQLNEEVLTYLHEHLNAADTLEGIIDWWLPRLRYEQSRAQIQKALDELVEQGLVERDYLSDGTAIYSSAERKKQEG
jgi:Fe2+ or Zn2+ uptake regulation protein